MTYEDFVSSLSAPAAPEALPLPLQVLWHDAKNDWERAHEIAQDIQDKTGSWLHAYLHRKEGDAGNAAYWYRKAGKPVPRYSLQQEWEEISREMVG